MCTQHWPFSYSSSSTPTILDREDIIVENNLFGIFCLNFMKCVKHMWQIPHDPKTRMSKRKKAAQFYSLRVWREKKSWNCKRIFCQHKDLSFSSFFLGQLFIHSLTISLILRTPSLLQLNWIFWFYVNANNFYLNFLRCAMCVHEMKGDPGTLSLVFSFLGIKIGD